MCKTMNYSDENRGKIQNRDRAKQIIDFGGMRYGNITPTDIDGYIDYHDSAFVFLEMKLEGADMPYGQRLALERLVNSATASGHDACAMLCIHNKQNPDEDVKAADTQVRAIYWKGAWHPPARQMTTKEMVDSFLRFTQNIL